MTFLPFHSKYIFKIHITLYKSIDQVAKAFYLACYECFQLQKKQTITTEKKDITYFKIISGFSICRYLDEINLMTYDMHGGSWEDQTAPNAPLKSHPKESGNQTSLNVVSLSYCI